MILLLQLVKAGGSVETLINRGLRYPQIGELINQAEDKEYIVSDENGLYLTKKGYELIQEDVNTGKIRRDGGWISPAENSRTTQINKFEVYLPPKNKSFFK